MSDETRCAARFPEGSVCGLPWALHSMQNHPFVPPPKPSLRSFIDPMLRAREVISAWYARPDVNVTMTGAEQELLIEAVAEAIARPKP